MLGRVIDPVLRAVEFLTRLPVPARDWREGALREALIAFPVAGALVGAIAGAVWWMAAQVVPGPVAAGLALAVLVWCTGALHEDGLGDVADGLGGHRDPERALEIMRDSRVGTYAVVAIVLSLGLRWAALSGLGPVEGAVALVVACTVSRAGMVLGSALAAPARPDGLGRMLGKGAGTGTLAGAFGIAVAVSLLAGAGGLIALAAAALVAVAVARLMVRRVGGMTGDGYGAIAAGGETLAMVVLAAAMTGGVT